MTPDNYNAMLSVTILPTLYSNFLDIDINWVFKIFYPVLFSVTALALYDIYRNELGERFAWLSTFFFMAIPVFYTVMTSLMKQPIAEIFMALTMLAMLSKNLGPTPKLIMMMGFGFSMVVSHYAISYIFMFILLVAFLVQQALKILRKRDLSIPGTSVMFLPLFVLMSLAWYMIALEHRHLTRW